MNRASQSKPCGAGSTNLAGPDHPLSDGDVAYITAALSTYQGGPAGDDVAQAWARIIARLSPGWLPIESAPKDGTTVLLFCPQGDGNPGSTFRVTAGSWCSEPGGTTEYRDGYGRWTGQDDREGFEGWLSWDGGFSESTMMPTHWMPLPTPPESSAPDQSATAGSDAARLAPGGQS